VGTADEAVEVEQAVERVSGVAGVESYLHVGLGPGDTRPSTGRAAEKPSPALGRLLDAATRAGVPTGATGSVVRAILATFAGRLPAGERDQVAAHLPSDVRELFTIPRQVGQVRPPRNVPQLIARVSSSAPEVLHTDAEAVIEAVLHELRSLVPDEAGDVAAVLPAKLQDLWQDERPT
jgi:uncharacterized protein (DUF2267 family)